MIDTDKYEGVKGSLVHSISNEEWKKLSPAGQALVADAPLLLQALIDERAEVKHERKIWIFTDEYEEEHEFTDPYEMMNYMWQHYIEDNVKIGWRKLK